MEEIYSNPLECRIVVLELEMKDLRNAYNDLVEKHNRLCDKIPEAMDSLVKTFFTPREN
jgi:hypothetical protein